MHRYMYCDKCGSCCVEDDSIERGCIVCKSGNIMKVVPTKYIREDEILTDKETDIRLQELREQIRNSPKCDHYFFEHRDEIVAKEFAKWDMISSHKDSSNKVSCPYCSSSNVNKIGMAGRLISVGLFGLGSKKIGKQWHCKNCGSDF